MKLKTSSLSLGMAILLSACYSEFPLDQTPQVELDPSILGTWRCLPPDPKPDTDPLTFVVATARPKVYSIRLEAKDEQPLLLEAYLSVVNGRPVLNVRDLDPRGPSKPWLFARYSLLLPNVLRAQIVQEDLLKSVEQTPAGYRRVLGSSAAQSSGYEDYAFCIRASVNGSAWN